MVFGAETTVATFVFIAAALATAGLLMYRGHRYFSRRAQPRPAVAVPRPQKPPAESATGMPGDLGRWEVDMHELARSLSAQLDTKMGLLEHLVREADRAAARLEAALEAARHVEAGHPAAPPAERPIPADPRRPAPRAADHRQAAVPADPASAPRPDEAPPAASAPRRFDEIYLLADYGYPVAEIAQRAGVPLGEVELILSLRGRG